MTRLAATKIWLMLCLAATVIRAPFGQMAVGLVMLMFTPLALGVDGIRHLIRRRRLRL